MDWCDKYRITEYYRWFVRMLVTFFGRMKKRLHLIGLGYLFDRGENIMGMKYKGKLLLAGLVSCMLLAQTAIAAIVEVEVEGVVDKVNELGGFGFDGSVAIGSVMSGYFRYDSEAVDQDLSEYTGLYSVISVSLSVGSYTFGDDLL